MARRPRSEIQEVLRGVPLFSHLSKGELRELAKLCFEEVYETDQVILKQLEEAQHMVAIITGRAPGDAGRTSCGNRGGGRCHRRDGPHRRPAPVGRRRRRNPGRGRRPASNGLPEAPRQQSFDRQESFDRANGAASGGGQETGRPRLRTAICPEGVAADGGSRQLRTEGRLRQFYGRVVGEQVDLVSDRRCQIVS